MKILLATDGSVYSDEAARFLTKLNLSADDEIVVLHALSWTPILSEWESLYADFKEIRYEIAPKILDATEDILKPVGARITRLLVDGYADKVIIDTAGEKDADLVVMGARGLRGATSLIVGSVTKAVAIKSPKPVLIIKTTEKKKAGNMKILFATDGSVYSDAMGKVLASIPFPAGTELSILNVTGTSFEDIPERFVMEIDDRIKKIVAGTRETEVKQSEKIIGKARGHLSRRFSNIEEMIRFGDPSLEILNAAEKLNADIIAVGSSGMRGIRGLLGSVSRYILNHAPCSVLVGKH